MIKDKIAWLSFAIHFSMVRVCAEMFTPTVEAVTSIEYDEKKADPEYGARPVKRVINDLFCQ